ncbi:hypothetical protein APHAL10511_000819 [Amanita phalloides]|nr:hypothetical protein APHAL10511_000819 [Amanita phalloides]
MLKRCALWLGLPETRNGGLLDGGYCRDYNPRERGDYPMDPPNRPPDEPQQDGGLHQVLAPELPTPESRADQEVLGSLEEYRPITVPGAMHQCRIVTEPEGMDKWGTREDKRPSYWLPIDSIDEETQAGDLTNQIKVPSMQPVALGGFSDIFKGDWRHRVSVDNELCDGTIVVALKLLRAFTRRKVDLVRAKKHLRKEVRVWNRLQHKNIARFYGVSFQFDGRPAIVMQWYKNGTAPQYLERQPEAIIQVAQGLKYLHTQAEQIVHGDIKGNNILVSDDGYALLSDFGLASVVEDYAGAENNTTTLAGSLRWQAPELLSIDDDVSSAKTLASDVWAFACTAFELFDGELPYLWLNYDFAILRAIYKGQMPIKEKGEASRLEMMENLKSCWNYEAAGRPGIEEVVEKLAGVTIH